MNTPASVSLTELIQQLQAAVAQLTADADSKNEAAEAARKALIQTQGGLNLMMNLAASGYTELIRTEAPATQQPLPFPTSNVQ